MMLGVRLLALSRGGALRELQCPFLVLASISIRGQEGRCDFLQQPPVAIWIPERGKREVMTRTSSFMSTGSPIVGCVVVMCFEFPAIAALLPGHFENQFQLDRSAEWKACDAVHQPARVFLFSENVL
jgi:hypothetical protein